MKVKNAITLEAKHGQYYTRCLSNELVENRQGKKVRKQYFEPTYVPLPKKGASEKEVEATKKLAKEVAEYIAELLRKRRPSPELQRKLMEFARRWAEDNNGM
jgi:DNA-binding helix-hairpin-helix protein with protein kinase domain